VKVNAFITTNESLRQTTILSHSAQKCHCLSNKVNNSVNTHQSVNRSLFTNAIQANNNKKVWQAARTGNS